MKIIKASYEVMSPDFDDPKIASDIYGKIERAGRTCYQSTAAITPESGEKFVRNLVKNGHEAMLEHAGMTVKFIADRGISHELVRHRLCSFAQESSRYCSYNKGKFGNEITVIDPCFFNDISQDRKDAIMDILDGLINFSDAPGEFTSKEKAYAEWYTACRSAEYSYFEMLKEGCVAQEARSVLPTSLKTELIMTANMREWRSIFKLRAAGEHGIPHPQMLEVMVPLLNECKQKLPALFDDIEPMEVI